MRALALIGLLCTQVGYADHHPYEYTIELFVRNLGSRVIGLGGEEVRVRFDHAPSSKPKQCVIYYPDNWIAPRFQGWCVGENPTLTVYVGYIWRAEDS